jgi:hypothetical protein
VTCNTFLLWNPQPSRSAAALAKQPSINDPTGTHSDPPSRTRTCSLGRGAFATVRRALHRASGQWYACKVITKSRFVHNPRSRQMFEREVAIMKDFDHVSSPSAFRFRGFFLVCFRGEGVTWFAGRVFLLVDWGDTWALSLVLCLLKSPIGRGDVCLRTMTTLLHNPRRFSPASGFSSFLFRERVPACSGDYEPCPFRATCPGTSKRCPGLGSISLAPPVVPRPR